MPNRPPAPAPAGSAQAGGASGRKGRGLPCTCGPMRVHFPRFLLSLPLALALALPAGPVSAQKAPAAPARAAPASPSPPEWRRTDGDRFPALADSVRRLQYVAQAMQLREYCADRRVPDDFVRERLQRFGSMTGREETCTSLKDY